MGKPCIYAVGALFALVQDAPKYLFHPILNPAKWGFAENNYIGEESRKAGNAARGAMIYFEIRFYWFINYFDPQLREALNAGCIKHALSWPRKVNPEDLNGRSGSGFLRIKT